MTCRELMARINPESINETFVGGVRGCPHDYDIFKTMPKGCGGRGTPIPCDSCWDREVPDDILEKFLNAPEECEREIPEGDNYPAKEIDTEPPHILDSGNRRKFDSGAVRDIQEGKGRCDLLPLDVVGACLFGSEWIADDYAPAKVCIHINKFKQTGEIDNLINALKDSKIFNCAETMLLEVSIHFEEGAKKYGENNWQKGIPVHCYIDSAVRHYIKFLRGDKDEPHDRAFCWNIMCAIWTRKHKPELNDYSINDVGVKKENSDESTENR